MADARRAWASPWQFVIAGILLGGCAGTAWGIHAFREAAKGPDEIFGHAFDVFAIVIGATGGAAAGAALGALVGSLLLGGISAATWTLGFGIGLGLGGWLLVQALVAADRGFDLLGILPLMFLGTPAVMGFVASWAVRRSESRRSGFGRDSGARP